MGSAGHLLLFEEDLRTRKSEGSRQLPFLVYVLGTSVLLLDTMSETTLTKDNVFGVV